MFRYTRSCNDIDIKQYYRYIEQSFQAQKLHKDGLKYNSCELPRSMDKHQMHYNFKESKMTSVRVPISHALHSDWGGMYLIIGLLDYRAMSVQGSSSNGLQCVYIFSVTHTDGRERGQSELQDILSIVTRTLILMVHYIFLPCTNEDYPHYTIQKAVSTTALECCVFTEQNTCHNNHLHTLNIHSLLHHVMSAIY